MYNYNFTFDDINCTATAKIITNVNGNTWQSNLKGKHEADAESSNFMQFDSYFNKWCS